MFDQAALLLCGLYCLVWPVRTAHSVDWLAAWADPGTVDPTYLCSVRLEWRYLPNSLSSLILFYTTFFRLLVALSTEIN